MVHVTEKQTGRWITLAGAVIGLLMLSCTAATSESHGKEDLEVTGFVDRPSIGEGDHISLLVNITNRRSEAVQLDSVRTLLGSDQACRLGAMLLGSNQTVTVRCRQTLEKEGLYNIGVQVLWQPQTKGGTQQSISKNIAQVMVVPSLPISTSNLYLLLLTLAVISIVAIGVTIYLITAGRWTERTKLAQSQILFRIFLIASIAITFGGLIAQSGTIVIAGLVSALISALLVIKGQEFLTNLMDRITKAGPFEFSPLTAKAQDLEIFKMQEVEFLKTDITIEEILRLIGKIDHYIAFFRLRAYALEASLIPYNPPIPSTDRITWLKQLQETKNEVGNLDFYKELRKLYNDIEKHERFKTLFEDNVTRTLQEAKSLQEEGKPKIKEAVNFLERHKAEIEIPTSLRRSPGCSEF